LSAKGFKDAEEGAAAAAAVLSVGVIGAATACGACTAGTYGDGDGGAEEAGIGPPDVNASARPSLSAACGRRSVTAATAAATTAAADEYVVNHLGSGGFCPCAAGGEDLGVGELAG
jgi:hypothetical protein